MPSPAGGAQRLVSLDAFRGLTMASMVMVNNQTGPASYYQLQHVAWHGWTFTDLVFPSFLWIVGVALTLSTARRVERGENKGQLLGHALRRAILIFVIGLLLNGFPFYNLSTLRIPGVLQRIAICYFIAALLYLTVSLRTLAGVLAGCLVVYTVAMQPGGYEKGANFAAWLDSLFLTGHMWSATKTWDPEGIFSTLPAIATCLFGVLTGALLRSALPTAERAVRMLVYGNLLIAAGLILSPLQPINKNLWTPTFTLFTAGIATVAFAICYWLLDLEKRGAGLAKPFVIFGMNAMAVYIFHGLLGRLAGLVRISGDSLRQILYAAIEPALGAANASLAYSLLHVLVCFAFAWTLHRRGWFLKL